MCLGKGRPEYRILSSDRHIWNLIIRKCLRLVRLPLSRRTDPTDFPPFFLCATQGFMSASWCSSRIPKHIDPSTNFLFHALVFDSLSSLFCWGALSHLEGQFSWLVGVFGSLCFSLLLSRILRLSKLLLFWVVFFYSKVAHLMPWPSQAVALWEAFLVL